MGMKWFEIVENRAKNDDDTGKINEDKREGARHRDETVWVWSRSLSSAPAAGPSCGTVITKTAVDSSLASRGYGKEGVLGASVTKPSAELGVAGELLSAGDRVFPRAPQLNGALQPWASFQAKLPKDRSFYQDPDPHFSPPGTHLMNPATGHLRPEPYPATQPPLPLSKPARAQQAPPETVSLIICMSCLGMRASTYNDQTFGKLLVLLVGTEAEGGRRLSLERGLEKLGRKKVLFKGSSIF